MPQKPLLRQPDPTPNVSLPTGEGSDPVMNQILRAITVATGLEHQKPGDAAGALGAMVPMLPIGRLLQLIRGGQAPSEAFDVLNAAKPSNPGDQLLREHLQLPEEFSPDKPFDPLGGLPEDELNKAKDLTQPPKPKRRSPGGL